MTTSPKGASLPLQDLTDDDLRRIAKEVGMVASHDGLYMRSVGTHAGMTAEDGFAFARAAVLQDRASREQGGADREAGRSAPGEPFGWVTTGPNGIFSKNREMLVYCQGADVIPLYAGSAPVVAWRDHVERRLWSWRQSFVNKHGDQLALEDFMDRQSMDDLINYVLDEWAEPRTQGNSQ